MTKIRPVSDVHSEFFRPVILGGDGGLILQPAGEDVLVLAGDIGPDTTGAEWAIATGRRLGVPVVMIAGNHEFYQTTRHSAYTVESVYHDLRVMADKSNGALIFLQDDVAVVAGVRFIGATFWTDFCLDGEANRYGAMRAADRGMNDYRLIYSEQGRWTPQQAAAAHEISLEFIRDELAQPFDGSTVVITHMAPSGKSIAPGYRESALNPAYASNHEDVVAGSGAALWIHGHVHHSDQYRLGTTLVVLNAFGYKSYEENPGFNPNLIIEV